MPSRVVVGFFDTTAYSGSLTKNPFNFGNYNIQNIKLKVASVPLPYSEGITVDFNNG
jgi:hypothetical protein